MKPIFRILIILVIVLVVTLLEASHIIYFPKNFITYFIILGAVIISILWIFKKIGIKKFITWIIIILITVSIYGSLIMFFKSPNCPPYIAVGIESALDLKKYLTEYVKNLVICPDSSVYIWLPGLGGW